MSEENKTAWKIGQNYFIRTVTHHYTGTLKELFEKELVFENLAWIPEDGRFADALKNECFSEVEPFPDRPIILGRDTVLDATPINSTFRVQK